MIEHYGKGAIIVQVLPETQLAAAIPVVDFTIPFQLPQPPDTDQGLADCCVGEGWSKYHWQFERTQFSVRSLFAFIAQQYGADIGDGGSRLVSCGQETFAEAPDPDPKTPANMRDKTGLDESLAQPNEEANLLQLQHDDINTLAYAIKNFQGAVFGVQGTNAGWQDMENPVPPTATEAATIGQPHSPVWGHCLYAMGYHVHSDGQRCIIAASSWCNEVKQHHIRESYFTSGNTFIGFTVTKKGQTMDQKFIININGTEGVLVVGQFAVSGALAKDQQTLDNLKAAFGFTGSEPTVTFPNQ
jgi:hypothetical protein